MTSAKHSHKPESRLVLAAGAPVDVLDPDRSGTFESAHGVTILHSDESYENSRHQMLNANLEHYGIMRCTGTSAEIGIR
jgi:hypothetical protein